MKQQQPLSANSVSPWEPLDPQVPKDVDVFKSTGVVVVGAATPDDGYLITNTVPARFTRSMYSNYGPGLALEPVDRARQAARPGLPRELQAGFRSVAR